MVVRHFVHGARRMSGTQGSYKFPGQRSSVQFLHIPKINGKTPTEGKLIVVNGAMTKIIWSGYFIEAQGYNISHNKVMQDNTSAIILEKRKTSAATSRPNTPKLGTSL